MKPDLRLLVLALAAAVPALSQVRIACIGNSITDHSHNQDAYPVKLNGYLGPGYSVENDGVSGCTLLKKGNKPYWTQGRLPQVFAFKPDIVTIKLGTNDSKTANWGPYKADFGKDLRALIDTLGTLSTKPKIWLCLPVPAWENTFTISGSVVKNEIIPIIKLVAQERNLPVIDLHTLMLPYKILFPDGVHPNVAGLDTLARHIFKALTATTSLSYGAMDAEAGNPTLRSMPGGTAGGIRIFDAGGRTLFLTRPRGEPVTGMFPVVGFRRTGRGQPGTD